MCVLRTELEIILQNTIVKQQLHVVFLYMERPMLIATLSFNKVILARLLFNKQF